MSISNHDNQKKSEDTKLLIANLKKYVSGEDLKLVIKLLQIVKNNDDSKSVATRADEFCSSLW